MISSVISVAAENSSRLHMTFLRSLRSSSLVWRETTPRTHLPFSENSITFNSNNFETKQPSTRSIGFIPSCAVDCFAFQQNSWNQQQHLLTIIIIFMRPQQETATSADAEDHENNHRGTLRTLKVPEVSNEPMDFGFDCTHQEELMHYWTEHSDNDCNTTTYNKLSLSSVHATPVATRTVVQQPSTPQQQELLQKLQFYIQNESWRSVLQLLQQDPSLAKLTVLIQCQGERTPCLPLHAAVARRQPCLDVLECLVQIHPAALHTPDAISNRWPLHLALLKGASPAIIDYLTTRHPAALRHADAAGNTPLHYACMYSPEPTCWNILQSYPAACALPNNGSASASGNDNDNASHYKNQWALHLLCARGWDAHQVVSLELLQAVHEAYPAAVRSTDRHGRLPLHHWATTTASSSSPTSASTTFDTAAGQQQQQQRQHPRADVLQWLVELYPEALIHKDRQNQTPLALSKLFFAGCNNNKRQQQQQHYAGDDDSVVAAFLRERTLQEQRRRRRQKGGGGLLLGAAVLWRNGTTKKPSVLDDNSCYG